jgi:hypothetical protein
VAGLRFAALGGTAETVVPTWTSSIKTLISMDLA